MRSVMGHRASKLTHQIAAESSSARQYVAMRASLFRERPAYALRATAGKSGYGAAAFTTKRIAKPQLAAAATRQDFNPRPDR
jgi:hypothetical protein